MSDRLSRWALDLAVAPLLLFLILPTLIVIPMALTSGSILEFPPDGISLRPFRDLLADDRWLEAGLTSAKVLAVSVPASLLLGTVAAVGLHGTRIRGRGLLVGLILAPIVLPLIVLALAMYRAFGSWKLIGTWQGIAMAHSLLAAPYVFTIMQASLSTLDPALVRSARSLGASAPAVLRFVYLPALLPGVAAGALLALVVSLDEAVVAYFLQGPGAVTLPVRMFIDFQNELSPKMAAVATLLVTAATLLLAANAVLLHRRTSLRKAMIEGAA